ncbi:BadF/BadG/BcrA/BcrD ATPase family protein [Curtobacterium sp. 1544]|uniref:N-acetylglucosamine kinase n=1 Tax=Curtobacterium sp. 1544 TaxID=3156417 RepID=UPI0033962400
MGGLSRGPSGTARVERPPAPVPPHPSDVVLAVDGGGSKTDVVAIALDGAIVGHARGPGSNPQTRGWDVAGPILDDVRSRVVGELGDRRIRTTHVYLAGLDLHDELVAATTALAHWESDGGAPHVLDNDLFALLRAGTLSPDAAAVVCGTGINALAVRADGTTARFPAIGDVSGDWGGGAYLGNRALWHAARADDGRGPATALVSAVPAAVGLRSVREVTEAIHFGRLDQRVFNRLCPVLFEVAAAGDVVASRVVARQAEEIVILAAVALERLGLGGSLTHPVPVVLGGGVLAARHPLLVEGVVSGLAERVPGAVPTWVTDPPVLGAGLAALESVGADEAALDRYREAVRSRSFTSTTALIH